ncbi:CDP-alcohol phosphatidyltransferase, partial [Thermus scotoductus]
MVPGAKARPVQEFLSVLLFHTGLALLAAWLLYRGEDLWAALLLQLKTVLDNADGQLARLRGEVSALGRYLDTEMDFLGNLALFVALALRTGEGEKALLAFLVFTLVQSFDFNLERLYREARGLPLPEEPQD